MMGSPGDGGVERPSVAVLREAFAGVELAATDAVIAALRQSGMRVEVLDGAQVGDPDRLTGGRYHALVLGDARFWPASALGTLAAYLRPAAGTGPAGSLVALGGPFLSAPQYRAGGRWDARAAAVARVVPLAAPLAIPPVGAWQPSGATPASRVHVTAEGGGLAFAIPDLRGWGVASAATAYPPGHTLVAFEARGTAGNGGCIVEWLERDGSRWIANVPLGQDWRPHVLTPRDFLYWPTPGVFGRGGPGDALHPEDAVRLSVGMNTSSGPQRFFLRGLGTLAPDAAPDLAGAALPLLTGLAPLPSGGADQAYIIPESVRLHLEGGQCLVRRLPEIGPARGAVSPVYRPRGLGLPGPHGPLAERFIPVVTARAADGALRGAPGAVLLHAAGPEAGAAWILLGLPPDLLASAAGYAAEFTLQALSAVWRGSWLLSGGTHGPAVDARSAIPLGASVVPGAAAAPLTVEFWLDGRRVAAEGVPAGAEAAEVRASAAAPEAPAAGETVDLEVRLTSGGQTLDTVCSALRFCDGPPARRQPLVTAVGGGFQAGGEPFRPVGINYWPRSTSGLRPELFVRGWLSPQLYDPDVVEADLAEMARLGFNLVSGVQYDDACQAPPLRDFLARCDAHGIRVNLFLAGASPLALDVDRVTALVAAAGLQRDGAVFAYDLAWEPNAGMFAGRAQQLAAPWTAWVEDRYGSQARARGAWGYPGGAEGPTDEQLLGDGPWRGMVAAYRRFLDDFVTEGYGRVWRALRDMGDAHLLGARTGYGGNGQMVVVTHLPLDLQGGALFLDFVSPEACGVGPDYAHTADCGLTTAYASAVGAGKPVFWAEWGLSIWADAVGLQGTQRELYRSMYRMMAESGAAGGAGWWFPGGYRVNEGSDYGIFNPDGTPRAAALEVSRAGAMQGASWAPDVWIAVDRDRHVEGYAGVLRAHGAAYVGELAAGRRPGVLLPGTGTTSADCPLTAVGGGPHGGFGPLQALNAAFVRVRADGVDVSDGGAVRLPTTLDVTLGNTAPAAWVDNVALSIHLPDGTVRYAALPGGPVPYLQTVSMAAIPLPALHGTIALRVEARGRAAFGPTFRLRA
jgi:hypothetical protein